MKRRDFLKGTTVLAAGALVAPLVVAAPIRRERAALYHFKHKDHFLHACRMSSKLGGARRAERVKANCYVAPDGSVYVKFKKPDPYSPYQPLGCGPLSYTYAAETVLDLETHTAVKDRGQIGFDAYVERFPRKAFDLSAV